MFICAKWKKLSDGCVARCDQPSGHEGKHLDSIIDIAWEEDAIRIPEKRREEVADGNPR